MCSLSTEEIARAEERSKEREVVVSGLNTEDPKRGVIDGFWPATEF